jgi:N6-adenosine-specific RNA methylase IME4
MSETNTWNKGWPENPRFCKECIFLTGTTPGIPSGGYCRLFEKKMVHLAYPEDGDHKAEIMTHCMSKMVAGPLAPEYIPNRFDTPPLDQSVDQGSGQVSFPTGSYKLILADPPWSYKNVKTGGSLTSGASDQYPTMSLEEIKALPVPSIAGKDCVLAMWATVPLLPEGLEVLSAWGFTYKTALFWKKNANGLGFWFRGEVEILLVGKRGSIHAFHSQQSNFIEAKSRKHSQKPGLVYEILEATGIEPRIELFARDHRQGWDAWGNQVSTSIQTTLESIFKETE